MINQQKPTVELTSNMLTCLCDLYSASGGEVGIQYPIKAHWNVIEALFKRGLIMRDAQIENGKVVRYIALTPTGAQYSCEHMELVINDGVISDSRPQKCVSLFFEYDEIKYPHHVNAYKHVGKLKSERNFRPTVIDLLNIDEQLDNGDTSLLEEMYPEAIDALKQKMRQEIETAYYEKIMSRLDSLESAPTTNAIGLKGLSGNASLQAPVFDDSDIPDLTFTKQSGKNAAQNLIDAMNALGDS